MDVKKDILLERFQEEVGGSSLRDSTYLIRTGSIQGSTSGTRLLMAWYRTMSLLRIRASTFVLACSFVFALSCSLIRVCTFVLVSNFCHSKNLGS
jgi:hypothetical protein